MINDCIEPRVMRHERLDEIECKWVVGIGDG